MACVALTSLMATIKLHEGFISMESLYEKLSSLQAFVQEKSAARGGTAIRDLEIQMRDFALDAEDRIEIQLSNFLLANNGEDQQKAAEKLHQTLGEAAENAAELLEKSKELETDDEQVVNESEGSVMIPWLKHDSASEPSNVVMVGRRRDRELIMYKLISMWWSKKLEVISIVGMAGIGKTTLISSVYNDPLVAERFDVLSWVSMPGGYNSGSQLLHILLWTLQAAGAEEREKRRIPDHLAAEQLCKCLKGKRYLIVLDNLWNNQAGYDIRHCLPDETNGSRIVITTTHFLRRGDNYAYSNDNIHNITLLNQEESWALFCNNPFLKLKKHMEPPKFQEIRSQVVEICEGLPYSILVVAKRLSKCDNITQEWKKVEKEIELLGVLDRRALTHTYKQLPQHLKVCFLYFGVFPKRTAIKVKLLIRLWIAEGFINPPEGKELESQAYEYLQEFIDRSLILIDNWSSSGKDKNYRMHSALHSFCEDADDIFISFKLLRVLAFAPSSFLQRVPARLHDLVFLRYLYVTKWFEGLDYVVSTNQNLQTLVVSSKESQLETPIIPLPSTIWELPLLRHLELDKSYVIDPPSMIKDNMRTLSWVCSTHCRAGVYCRFPYIEKLKVFVFCSNPIILDNLEYLERLEILSISISFGCVVTLPKPSMFPSQLKKLRLNGTKLSESDLKAIEMLPQLEVLKLENAFDGKVWEVEGGFCQLKFLLLEDKTLEQWMVDDESFPNLEHLVLRFCYCLEEIPKAIEYISRLRSIELQWCTPSVCYSTKRIQDFRHEMADDLFELKIIGEESIPADDEWQAKRIFGKNISKLNHQIRGRIEELKLMTTVKLI
ncbi:PREDICTED: putative late blight resistance protein homolog R1A-10 [Ipomoea nil]|uniref:putative late blight resistance protein homolog R1A-10 n=1 Tax=Ipomoea nil TaxID=35883 RepID=UPI0009017FC5|nr:PREDICTED: putative late blight resistance protein homolog R1A-10 [Ipomoea nil]